MADSYVDQAAPLNNGTLPALTFNNAIHSTVPIIVFSLVAALFLRLIFWPSSKGQNKPPVVPGVPIIGGFLHFLKGPTNLITEFYPKFGAVFTVPVFHKRITFLIGPEVSSHFFKASEDNLSQEEVYGYSGRTFGPTVVFSVSYKIRVEQFRFFADSLKLMKMRTYVNLMVQEAEEALATWGDKGEIDLKEEMARIIILTASRCLLGREVREQMFDEVSHLFHKLDEGMIPISVVAPWLPIKVHRERDKARLALTAIFSNIIRKRRASGAKEDDMLQVFMDSTYRSTGKQTTEADVAGLLIAALFAGQHTSSLTSAWIGAYFATNKDTYAPALLKEQAEVQQRHGDKLNYDIVSEMDVLHRFMKETLRLHPPLIMLLRYNHADFKVTSKEGREYTIPKGDIVATSTQFSNRLPYVYKEPNKFDPDRFAPGREEDKYMPFSYTAFGGGRHGCMGETFAYMQIKTIWSLLLRRFDFELLVPFPEIDDKSSLVAGPKGKVMVRYTKRSRA
eukprot:TRINITY_DN1609_c0_g1_i1.p1 TRINITY_DN1609_c0_g1~~TRINITY_DN1609_c0_g1_i1.p1  ORF type:complete len:507 (-),score=87.18 TRINITY_DN1609_c0_g1_i1:559-2079(-)